MATEKRLIDANALDEHIKDLPTWWADGGGFYGGAMKYPEGMFVPEDIISSIENAPTVDAVEVVRCKDCKHGIWDEEEQMWECIVGVDLNGDADIYAMFHEYNDGDHFCSYGERRGNGN